MLENRWPIVTWFGMNGTPLNATPQSEKKHGGPMYLRRGRDTCDTCFPVLKWCMTKDLGKKCHFSKGHADCKITAWRLFEILIERSVTTNKQSELGNWYLVGRSIVWYANPPPGAAAQPNAGHGLLILEVSSHTHRRITVGRTPLDAWSVCRRDLWQQTTLTTERHPRPRWDSNPQSQQASGRRPTP